MHLGLIDGGVLGGNKFKTRKYLFIRPFTDYLEIFIAKKWKIIILGAIARNLVADSCIGRKCFGLLVIPNG